MRTVEDYGIHQALSPAGLEFRYVYLSQEKGSFAQSLQLHTSFEVQW